MKTSTGAVVVVFIALAAAAQTGGIDSTPPAAPPAVEAPAPTVGEPEPVELPIDAATDADEPRPPSAYEYYECNRDGVVTAVRPDTPAARAGAQENCTAMNSHFDSADWPDPTG